MTDTLFLIKLRRTSTWGELRDKRLKKVLAKRNLSSLEQKKIQQTNKNGEAKVLKKSVCVYLCLCVCERERESEGPEVMGFKTIHRAL